MNGNLGLFVVLFSLKSLSLFAMDSSNYDLTLKGIVEKGRFSENEMGSEEWGKLGQVLSADITVEQFQKQAKIATLLELGGIEIHSQRNNPKDMARVVGRKTGFRAISDLLAFRIKANTQGELADNLEKLERIASEQNGKIFLKPLYQGKPDVIRSAFIYFPTQNVIVEFQVGHEFSLITFANDTMLTVSPELRQSRTDFWTNNFYTDMVSAILSGNTEKDLRGNFLEIIKGKEEESEENSVRKTVLSVVDGIEIASLHL